MYLSLVPLKASFKIFNCYVTYFERQQTKLTNQTVGLKVAEAY